MRLGATINITYQAVNVAKTKPVEAMTTFADVLEKLVKVDGYTNVRWVTVANEPNSTVLTMAEYEALNRALDAQLVARGLREQIRMMGGDLVSTSQRAWFSYIAANMNDLFDAYSVHVYWDYWDTPFFKEKRLKDIRKIVTEELPASARKPTYVMEFGVRGKSFPGKPNVESGYWDDGTDIARTNVAAFQQLWFDLAAAQLGFTGSVKWDAYWGRYHGTLQLALLPDRACRRRAGRSSPGTTPRTCCSRPLRAAGRCFRWGRGTRTTGRSASSTRLRRSSRHTRAPAAS